MLVLRDDVPVRLVVKDFVDDMMVSQRPAAGARGHARRRPAALWATASRPRSSCSGSRAGCWSACTATWRSCWTTGSAIPRPRSGRRRSAPSRATRQRFPELEQRFALFDMDAPAFVKLCLNRVRLLERGYADSRRAAARRRGRLDRQSAGAGMSLPELAVHVEHEPALDRRLWARPGAARARHRAAVDVDAQAARRPVLGDGLAAGLDPRLPRAPDRGPGALAAARVRRRHPGRLHRGLRPVPGRARRARAGAARATSARTC